MWSYRTYVVNGSSGGEVTLPDHLNNITEEDITNWNSKATVVASTEDLEAGVSELATGTIYVVYE